MSYTFDYRYDYSLNKEDCPFRRELLALERDRIKLRIELADKHLEELAKPHGILGGGFVMPKEEDKKAWELRQARRAFEYSRCLVVPPGPWDSDLDAYPGTKDYPVKLPPELAAKGYTAYAKRTYESRTWNGYVSLPPSHPYLAERQKVSSSTYYANNEAPSEMPYPPQKITFHYGCTLGWDHSYSSDVSPSGYKGDLYHAPLFCGPLDSSSDGSSVRKYLDFAGITRECVEFTEWLEKVKAFLETPASSTA